MSSAQRLNIPTFFFSFFDMDLLSFCLCKLIWKACFKTEWRGIHLLYLQLCYFVSLVVCWTANLDILHSKPGSKQSEKSYLFVLYCTYIEIYNNENLYLGCFPHSNVTAFMCPLLWKCLQMISDRGFELLSATLIFSFLVSCCQFCDRLFYGYSNPLFAWSTENSLECNKYWWKHAHI